MARAASGLWDDAMADRIVGATVLVGVTYLARGDAPERHEQFYGRVVEANRFRGVILELLGSRRGEQHRLPAATSALVPAEPGIYRLSSTGEEVIDPDYVTTWTVQPPGS